MENPQNNKPKRNFLVIYSIALFLFAAVLIGLSYLSQARVASEADRVKQELSDKTEVAAGFESRLEQVTRKNADLETANAEQKKQLEALQKQVEELTAFNATVQDQIKRTNAAEYLWKLIKSLVSGDYKSCNRMINEIDKAGLRPFFSAEGLKELERIEKITKGE